MSEWTIIANSPALSGDLRAELRCLACCGQCLVTARRDRWLVGNTHEQEIDLSCGRRIRFVYDVGDRTLRILDHG